MALDAGANVRACELKTPCSNPCRGCDSRPFPFWGLYWSPPLGAQDVTYKDPTATVMGTRAAAFLFLDGFAVFALRVRGSRYIPSTLGFWEGMEGPLRLGSRRLQTGTRRYWYQCSFCKLSLPTCLWSGLLAQAGGRHYALCGAAEYLRC